MAPQPRLNFAQAERRLLEAGFVLLRVKGSHYTYGRAGERIQLPFHGKEPLHPKIVRQVLLAVGGFSPSDPTDV